tara:strand:- start:31 stop:267 length:237 start_codon:yes stop_codon:yes gene_type:complete
MKNIILISIVLVGVCLLISLTKLGQKSLLVESLQEKNHNQELFIERLYESIEYKYTEQLNLEIMDLGAQLDSMKLKYD